MTWDSGFTFYGDLLGIGAAYQLGPQVAYTKLNDFYNTVFERLHGRREWLGNHLHVQMFSDSVVAWNERPEGILEDLQSVYLKLLGRGLLLRGAIVDGALEREPRVEGRNFRKFLPANDTLARAVGLEKTVKGARLLIEPALAQKILSDQPQWLTVEGYVAHPDALVPMESMLRRICPAPSGSTYELLYGWSNLTAPEVDGLAVDLEEHAAFQDTYVAEHFSETIKVLHRSQLRQRQSERALMRV
jgi:hypothetical protein